jgi:hypothetical protein
MKITLTKPVEHDGKTVTELTFKAATTGDAMAADVVSGDFSKTVAILAGMCEQSLPFMRKVALADTNRIASEVATAGLLGELSAPPVGGTW